MTVPFIDLQQINSRFETSFQKGWSDVMFSGRYILGDQLTKFELEFASYCGTSSAIGVGSGLDALSLIFESYIHLGRLKPGDKILVPAHTYIASVMSILNCGLFPVLVEPDLKTFNLDFNDLASKYSHDVKAVLAVHMYGQLVDSERLMSFCNKYDLLCIEDAAQAHGAKNFSAVKAGHIGSAAAFSFYPTKNLGALGDGGAVTTDDQDLAELVRQLRDYGRISRSESVIFGVNSRLDEIQACFLSAKLKSLDTDNEKRRIIACRYLEEIENPIVELPYFSKQLDHVWHIFAIRSNFQKDIIHHLDNKGISAMVHYPIPIHRQKVFSPWADLNLPVTDQISRTEISLPISPIMTSAQVDHVISAVNYFTP